MSNGVFTRMKRFTLVEKASGLVGDGTAWPMLVTRDQLAEIMYRVRDAVFTAGSLDATGGSFPIEFSGGAPGSPFADQSGDEFSLRSYHTVNALAGGLSGYFGAGYTFTDIVGAKTAYDVTDERGVWIHPDALPRWWGEEIATNIPTLLDTGRADLPFVCGFSHYVAHGGASSVPSNYCFYKESFDFPGGTDPVEVCVNFSGEVAWVDADGSGNPFSPGNELYVGVRFDLDSFDFPSQVSSLSIDPSGRPDFLEELTSIRFGLELAGSVILYCALYVEDFSEIITGSDFILSAKEWWPYAKGSPATDVWNTLTGIKI